MYSSRLSDPSVKTVDPEPRMINIIQGEDWRASILAYLQHHYELNNTTELNRMQQRAKAYQIIRYDLYKTSVIGLLLCCVSRNEGKELLTLDTLGFVRRQNRSKISRFKGIQAWFLLALYN
jgi:hypothetical protein